MSDVEPLYTAEQLKVPEGFAEILKEYSKEVIRVQPADILAWSANYFAEKARTAGAAGGGGGR